MPEFELVCLNNATVVMSTSYGNLAADGGTQFDGDYYVSDSNSTVIDIFKSKHTGLLNTDPVRGDMVDVTGRLEYFPYYNDGGWPVGAMAEITGSSLQFTAVGSGTVPSAQNATTSQLADNSDTSLVASYVHVPAGSYTQDNAATEMHTATGYQDGLALVSGSDRMLVETFTYKYSPGNCFEPDGGFPDLSGGNFNAILDQGKGPDGNIHKMLYYGQCGQ